MSVIFRSEEMYLCEIYIPVESAYSIMAVLGEQRIVEFTDLNEMRPKGRQYTNEVQMCEDLEGKVHYLRLQTKDYNVKVKSNFWNPPAPNRRQIVDLRIPGTADFDLLRKLYSDVKQISYNLSPLERTVKLHLEYQAILRTACNLLFQKVTSLSDMEAGLDFKVHIIGGVLPRAKWFGFEKTLWRICHGNYILQVSDLPSEGNEERRLFVILVHGTLLKDKISKLCQSYSADMYDIPESRRRCSDLSQRNKSIIADLMKAVATSKEHYIKLLKMVAANLHRWLVEIKKMKSIYHNMNKFKLDETQTFLIAECWIPEHSFETFRTVVFSESKKVGCDIMPMVFQVDYNSKKPPTYFRLNKFTKSFQNIIDAYGIANYKELNPMPYTVITFPFLFAVMFGDIGHALILTMIGLVLIMKEKQFSPVNSEIFKMIFKGRYIILLMGLFSVYTGFIYNDFFGNFIVLEKTKWSIPKSVIDNTPDHHSIVLDPKNSFDVPAIFGIDPIWRVSENEIRITNSLKMKISIIIGIVHMTFGMILSLLNMIYFKDYVSIFAEFIPQLIFFVSVFGYFVVLIVVKWLTYGTNFPPERSPYCAPSIIITFVKGVPELPDCDREMFPGQHAEAEIFMLAAVLSIPWMLLVKPLYYICKGIPPQEKNTPKRNTYQMESSISVNLKKKQEISRTGDIIIYQIIHTIEFVLGTVSYTASYLRLWALSLAHQNLTHVLDVMVLNNAMKLSLNLPSFIGGIVVVIAFFFWALLTLAILIIMEGLSAFLHALRLHWMEFQTKFYVGQGYPFTPFSFKNIRKEAAKDLE